MANQDVSTIHVDCDRFLHQVVTHHRCGDYYPDPGMIGQELRLTVAQVENVLIGLRALGWIAASPYGPERLRLTPRCWNFLRQMTEPPATVLHATSDNGDPVHWQSVAAAPYSLR